MTTCLSKDGFDEESGKTQLAQQLERLLQRYLQDHFPAPPYSSGIARPSQPSSARAL